MGDDERATLNTLNAYRAVFRDRIGKRDGRVVDSGLASLFSQSYMSSKMDMRLMPKTLVLSDREIAPSFLEWAANQRESGVQLICVEGLPDSGKSWLLRHSLDANFRGIELDCFLRKPAPHTISWVEQVTAGGAVQFIRAALDKCDCVVVEGPAAWPVVMPIVENLGRSAVRRFYLKKMSKSGGVIDWLDGDGLLEHAATREEYWQSIYKYHGKDRPWLSADVVFERVPEE